MGKKSCGLDLLNVLNDDASCVGKGSPNIEVFALLLLATVENKAGVEVMIASGLLLSCLSR